MTTIKPDSPTKRKKYYSTMSAARGALALDTGFDPFVSGGWGRCTKAKLAEQGYVVDPRRAAEIQRGHYCSVCQKPVRQKWDGREYYWPDRCYAHLRPWA